MTQLLYFLASECGVEVDRAVRAFQADAGHEPRDPSRFLEWLHRGALLSNVHFVAAQAHIPVNTAAGTFFMPDGRSEKGTSC